MTDTDIAAGPGPLRFDRFMELALYGPNGFYAGRGRAGRRGGDFITSPEVGPLFGAVLAEALDSWWTELGQPDRWPIYDVGCGPGALLNAVAVARPDRPWEYIGVDRVDSAGAALAELPDDLTGAMVIGNELLDNLPFRILERTGDGHYREVFVDLVGSPEQQPAEVLRPLDIAPPFDIPVGTRAPMLDQAAEWVRATLDRNPARLCLFDYGAPTTAELATRGGWLRTYRQHHRGSDPLADAGHADITTDVAWDQLPSPRSLHRQADVLRSWGIERLVEEGRRHWIEHAAAPDLTAIRMRSRIAEAGALLDEDGLGGWWVAVW